MALRQLESEEEFQLNLLFEGRKQPSEAFKQLADVFDAFYEFDKWILRHISSTATFQYSLDQLEYGSIKTLIVQILKGIPDDALKDLSLKKLLGSFLVKAKYLLLRKLEGNKMIASKKPVEELTAELNREVKEFKKYNINIVFNEVNVYVVLNNIEEIAKIVNHLPKDETLEYKTKFGTARLQKGIHVNKIEVIKELGATTITNETTEILKIKKIDFLSNEAMWEFKLGTRTISAKVLDFDWLDRYHKREVDLKPEDALKVILKTSYTYSSSKEHTEFHFYIIEVISIVRPDSPGDSVIEIFEN